MRDVEVVSPHARLVTRRCSAAGRCSSTSSCSRRSSCSSPFSFNANKYGTFPFTGWTTHWYGQVFGDYQIRDALTTTLKIAFAGDDHLDDRRHRSRVSARALAAAVPERRPDRDDAADHDPRAADRRQPARAADDVFHLQLSPQTAVIGQAVYTTPFVLLLVAARLQGFDPSLERAASDLGANTYRRLRHVVLPLIAPAIFAGALFAFTLSLDEFIITLFLIGAHNTLPIYIYTQVKFGITPEVNALATLLLAASLTLIALAFAVPLVVRRTRLALRARRLAEGST